MRSRAAVETAATSGGADRTTIPLHTRALSDLAFIRETMERTTQFTAVSGRGGVLMGVVALVASVVAHSAATPFVWLATWLVAAALAFVGAGIFMIEKARAADVPILAGPGKKFLLSLLPAMAAGAVLTAPLYQAGQTRVLPAVWLLLYGTAVIAAGVFSIRIIPVMGLCFLVIGAVAAFAPAAAGNLLLGAGFGVVNIVFGLIIARKYGG
jgi:hypothetical protein